MIEKFISIQDMIAIALAIGVFIKLIQFKNLKELKMITKEEMDKIVLKEKETRLNISRIPLNVKMNLLNMLKKNSVMILDFVLRVFGIILKCGNYILRI